MSTCMQAGPHLESRQGVAVSEQTEGLAVRARRQPRVVCARVALHTYAHAERERERGRGRQRAVRAGGGRQESSVGHQGSSGVISGQAVCRGAEGNAPLRRVGRT